MATAAGEPAWVGKVESRMPAGQDAACWERGCLPVSPGMGEHTPPGRFLSVAGMQTVGEFLLARFHAHA
jgi:hypothetical protein